MQNINISASARYKLLFQILMDNTPNLPIYILSVVTVLKNCSASSFDNTFLFVFLIYS